VKSYAKRYVRGCASHAIPAPAAYQAKSPISAPSIRRDGRAAAQLRSGSLPPESGTTSRARSEARSKARPYKPDAERADAYPSQRSFGQSSCWVLRGVPRTLRARAAKPARYRPFAPFAAQTIQPRTVAAAQAPFMGCQRSPASLSSPWPDREQPCSGSTASLRFRTNTSPN
jgi:hypothetical protein